MIAAPLNLDLSFPRKIELTANLEGGEHVRELTTRCELNFGQNKDNARQWQTVLTVHFEGKGGAGPYKGCVEYVGLFTVSADYPEEKMARLVAITCPSMLYSSARELVALLTGRGPHRALMLPSVSFQDTTLNGPQEKPAQ